jgi:NAD(P)-dependent dehydrogenase (short-subunit alcohol dehydrogenase family)
VDKKIVLVTGGNRGIGYQVCLDLAKLNHIIILSSRSLEDGLKSTEKLQSKGYHVEYSQLDVIDQDSISDTYEFIRQKYGKLDVLVNNAGVHKSGTFAKIKEESIRETLDINLIGPWLVAQCMLPLLKKSRDGRIINVSSGGGKLENMNPEYAAYRVSKLGLNGLTMIMANELSKHNIKVNAVSPGWVRTDMGGGDAPRSVEQGADTINWLAITEKNSTGKFFHDREETDW